MSHPTRQCGDCSACCTVMAVDELGKPAGAACNHLKPTGGCGIYDQRPPSCRSFYCRWRAEGDHRIMKKARKWGVKFPVALRENERPDKLGVMLYLPADSQFAESTKIMMTVARETRPGAFDESSTWSTLQRFASDHLVVLVRGESRRLIGPKHLVAKAMKFVAHLVENEAQA